MRAQFGWRTMVGAVALTLIASQGWAQRQNQPAPGQPQLQPAQPAQQVRPAQQRTALRPQDRESMADHEIATWLIVCNEAEVALAQWGVKETQDKKIRQFAEKIIPQHEALIQQLRQFAPDAPPLGYQRNSQREENQQADQVARQQAGEPQQAAQAQRPATAPFGQTQTGQVEQQPGAAREHGLPHAKVGAELARRELSSLEKELASKRGEHREMAFIGTLVMKHLAMYNTLEVLRPYASAQLQNVIDQGIQTTESHLQEARQICDSLAANRDGSDKSDLRDQSDRENKE